MGNVTLLTQAIYMSKCTIDVTYYPFDAQICELKFASWTTEVTRVSFCSFFQLVINNNVVYE